MLHELRTYTARPGAVPDILKVNEEVGRKAVPLADLAWSFAEKIR